jgi:hypothetical protein
VKRSEKKSDGFEWAFRDLLIALLVVFMAMSCLAMLANSPQVQSQSGPKVGALTIEMQWANGSRSDIDLWVKSPNDAPVGYTRKTGKNCDLIRDDLGVGRDIASKADEMVACRVVPPGEYIVNVHAYRLEPNEAPMRVTIYVRAKLVSENNFYEVAQQSVDLNHEGDQVTVLRFSLNEHGALVPDSINNLQADLRSSGN